MPSRHTLTTLDQLPPGTARSFVVGGRRIALFNAGGRIFATDDTCTHEDASLAEGALEGTTITCPRHGAEFDIATGQVLCLPAFEDLKTHPVFTAGDAIGVEIA